MHDLPLRARRPLRIASALFVAAITVYLVVIPAVEMVVGWSRPAPTSQVLEEMSVLEAVRQRVIEVAAACWFFYFGATIGSFLNVLVYRMPRGESVIWRRSRCPACGYSIAGRDNLPILGWLLLGGKCRNCQSAISSRYPWVELTMALMVLALYFVELLSGGANIPRREPNAYAGLVWVVFYTKWDLVGLFLIHSFVFAALLTWALLVRDGERIPARSWILAIGVTVAASWWLPWHPPLLCLPEPVREWRGTLGYERAMSSLAGLATGVGCALLVRFLIVGGRRGLERSDVRKAGCAMASLALCGASGGWQGLLGVVLISLLTRFACLTLLRGNWRSHTGILAGHVLAGAFIHQLAWRPLSEGLGRFWPGPATSWLQACGFVGGISLLAIASRLVSPVTDRLALPGVPHSEGHAESVD